MLGASGGAAWVRRGAGRRQRRRHAQRVIPLPFSVSPRSPAFTRPLKNPRASTASAWPICPQWTRSGDRGGRAIRVRPHLMENTLVPRGTESVTAGIHRRVGAVNVVLVVVEPLKWRDTQVRNACSGVCHLQVRQPKGGEPLEFMRAHIGPRVSLARVARQQQASPGRSWSTDSYGRPGSPAGALSEVWHPDASHQVRGS